jgi:hypothetical protein
MTEDEAKTKTCPLSIGIQPLYAPGGQGVRDGGPWPCGGSECMAWRWDNREQAHLPPGQTPEGDGWIKREMWKDGRYRHWERLVHGYCGMAGRP